LSSIEKSVEKNVRALILSAVESVAKAKDCMTSTVASAVPQKATRSKKRAARRLKPARSAR
jgi:hypothetical protein